MLSHSLDLPPDYRLHALVYHLAISPLNQDRRNVFFFMYLATDPEELRHKDTFNMDTFTANRNSFYSEHVIYDPTIRLPKFERLNPSHNTGMTSISITVTDTADAEFHGKRKGNNEQAESLRPAKQLHTLNGRWHTRGRPINIPHTQGHRPSLSSPTFTPRPHETAQANWP
jgi:hypothetical protein